MGVGSRIDVAERIKKTLPLTDVIVTDREESWARTHKSGRVHAVADDAMYPQLAIYQGASLIYSIHPPIEIVRSLIELSSRVDADLMLVPRSDEQEMFLEDEWEKIIRSARTIGWKHPSHGKKSRS